MAELLHILHLEDEPLDSELTREQFRAEGMNVQIDRIETLEALQAAIDDRRYSLVLSDYTIPGINPLDALRICRERRPDVPFVFLSGTIGEELATQALKLGANDYVLKQRLDRLGTVVRRALSEAREQMRRREAEEALRRSDERLRLAHEVARIGTFEWFIDSELWEWSTELEALYGVKPGEFGHTREIWRRHIHPDDVNEVERRLSQAVDSREFVGEWRVSRPDGAIRWIAARGTVLSQPGGGPSRMVGVNFDITERKRAEEALLQAKQSAELAKERAEEANRAKDRFLAILSHELRTPLTAVIPALESLQSTVADEGREFLAIASRNVALEVRLIDDLLDVTRIARGKVELQPEALDVTMVLKQALEVCRKDIESHGVHFAMRVDQSPQWVEGDPARLQQVFWNLIQNAVKFTPTGGCIGIRCRVADVLSITEVQDSGVGIECNALSRIFDPFEQEAKTTIRQFGGLGLGLTISKSLVELHGGTIQAHSEGRDKGATFVVQLPLMRREARGDRDRRSPPQAAGAASKLRILLVEDHADTAKILAHLLRRSGHEVAHASDLAAAKARVDEQRFDVIISDLGLPDGSGHMLLQYLISQGKQIPAIALSGYGSTADIEHSLQAGFREHIVKPVTLARLAAAVERAMQSQVRP